MSGRTYRQVGRRADGKAIGRACEAVTVVAAQAMATMVTATTTTRLPRCQGCPTSRTGLYGRRRMGRRHRRPIVAPRARAQSVCAAVPPDRVPCLGAGTNKGSADEGPLRCRCRAAGLWNHAPRPRRRGHAEGPAWCVFSAVRPRPPAGNARRGLSSPGRCKSSGTTGFVHQSGVGQV